MYSVERLRSLKTTELPFSQEVSLSSWFCPGPCVLQRMWRYCAYSHVGTWLRQRGLSALLLGFRMQVLLRKRAVNNKMSQTAAYENRRWKWHKIRQIWSWRKEGQRLSIRNTQMQVWIPESMGEVLRVCAYINILRKESVASIIFQRIWDSYKDYCHKA